VVHRDIKPENIMVRKDGIAQIMDFGLAKLKGVSRLTKEGSTVGTAGYMSPEQIQGQDADHRSDIFSLGVLLYEMLTGQLPFKGVHETAIAYEIVNVDAQPMAAVKPEINPDLDRIVLECLEKDPSERFQSAAEIAKELKRYKRESSRQRTSRITATRSMLPPLNVQGGSGGGRLSGASRFGRPSWLPWSIVAALLVLMGGLLVMFLRAAYREVPLFTAAIHPAGGSEFLLSDGGHLALSPDGTMLAFVAVDTGGGTALWVRRLDSDIPRKLLDTEGAEYPFWSHDSRFIGFFVPGKMKKVLASGGPPFVICDAPSGRGASWNSDDVIIFSPKFDRTGIDRISANGGEVTHVTTVDSSLNMSNARWPHFLPDGKHFLFTTQAARRTPDFSGAVYVGDLDGSPGKLLMNLSTNVEYRDGQLLYVRQDALVSQPFDPGTLELADDAVHLVEKIGYAANRSKGVFSSSLDGILLYLSTGSQGRVLSWIERQENILVSLPGTHLDNYAYLSRDDSRILYDAYDPVTKNYDVWSFEIARGLKTRLTSDPSDDSSPIPSPDGKRFVYTSWKDGVNIYVKNSTGTDESSFLQKSITSAIPTDWSSDGQFLLFQDVELTADWDVWYLSMDGGKARPLIKTEFTEENAMFSPDGRWVAYNSNESGRHEVYAIPFPAGNGKVQVSGNGGRSPVWGKNGSAIFYVADEGAVVTRIRATKDILSVGDTRLVFRYPSQAGLRLHGVTADGNRLLVSHFPSNRGSIPLTMVTNWRRIVELR
jgi:Tol biopolymer transport system component